MNDVWRGDQTDQEPDANQSIMAKQQCGGETTLLEYSTVIKTNTPSSTPILLSCVECNSLDCFISKSGVPV